MVPEFVVKIKEPGFQLTWPVLAEDYFYMMLSTKSDKLNKFFLQVSDGRIYMRNDPEGSILAYIDIGFSRLKVIKSVETCGKNLSCIRFIKNRNYEEIFHSNLQTIDKWIQILKKYCVQSKFREHFSIGKELGRGNFAKVYVTKKMSQD